MKKAASVACLIISILSWWTGPLLPPVYAELVSVDAQVSVTFTGLRLNRRTRTFDSIARVTNTSGDPIQTPLSLVITTPSAVTLANPSGLTSGNLPFLDVPTVNGALAPGETSGTILLKFRNATRSRFTFGHNVLGTSAGDVTAPTLTQPPNITVDGTSANGVAVVYTTPTATDTGDPNPTVTCTPPSGSNFPVGPTTVTCTATDTSGNQTQVSFSVTVIDPDNVDNDGDGTTEKQGDCDDGNAAIHPGAIEIPNNGIDEDCNGSDLVDPSILDSDGDGFTPAQGDCDDANTAIHPGAVDIPGNGIDEDCSGEDAPVLPVVTITSPLNLSLSNANSVRVSGTVDDVAATVKVNGISASVSGGSYTAVVSLHEGNNALTAVAINAAGRVGSASIQMTVDSTPPTVTIDSPPDGLVTTDQSITVTGMINDIVVGTVNSDEASVTVNGVSANVGNRSFLADGVLLSPGENTITATGVDRTGNRSTSSITVVFEAVMAEPTINLVSGNNQRGQISTRLPQPLIVALRDGAGNPVPDKTVIFEVMENNGVLGPDKVRALVLKTDAQGKAQSSWTLGARAGAGNNMVDVTAVGFSGMAVFTAIATPAPADKINVDAGNNQTGVSSQALPHPLAAVVTDAGHNRLPNIPVTFTVKEGGGHFNGQSSLTLNSDSDGRVLAVLTLGTEEGFDNNRIEATFLGNHGFPASFVASGKHAGDPAATQVSGVVLDNMDQPVAGVTMRIDGSNLIVQTDAQGQFVLQPAPVGHVELIADGSTAQRPGTWPTLKYELVTVAGQDNTIGMPIFLLPLDTANQLCVTETEGGVLTLPDLPGFSLKVAAGSATFPDGSKEGCISVTPVHADKIPMTPNFGQQPRLIVTIQPTGVVFDPPAPITVPNVDGLAPGEVTELYSFDHDLGQFAAIGTGTVSEDGMVVESDPGVGILKGGWHCGGNPAPTGSAGTCPDCQKCEVDDCVPDETKDATECDDGDGCTINTLCAGGSCSGGEQAKVEILGIKADDQDHVEKFVDALGGKVDVQFNANIEANCPDLEYEWDFGDGFKSTESSPLSVYREPGTYTVSLTVRCKDCKGSETTFKATRLVTIKRVSIKITTPGNGDTILESSIIVGGNVDMPEGSRIKVRSVPASESLPGRFLSENIFLVPGENRLVAVVIDENNETTALDEITVQFGKVTVKAGDIILNSNEPWTEVTVTVIGPKNSVGIDLKTSKPSLTEFAGIGDGFIFTDGGVPNIAKIRLKGKQTSFKNGVNVSARIGNNGIESSASLTVLEVVAENTEINPAPSMELSDSKSFFLGKGSIFDILEESFNIVLNEKDARLKGSYKIETRPFGVPLGSLSISIEVGAKAKYELDSKVPIASISNLVNYFQKRYVPGAIFPGLFNQVSYNSNLLILPMGQRNGKTFDFLDPPPLARVELLSKTPSPVVETFVSALLGHIHPALPLLLAPRVTIPPTEISGSLKLGPVNMNVGDKFLVDHTGTLAFDGNIGEAEGKATIFRPEVKITVIK